MIVREKKEALARDVLRLAEGSIQRKLPAFGAALGVMEGEWTARGSGTDVQKLYWNREEVFRLFREGLEQVERRYLHLLLHGMYLHGLRGRELPERVWWLACDLMTEYRIDRMHVRTAHTGRTEPVVSKASGRGGSASGEKAGRVAGRMEGRKAAGAGGRIPKG